jgi:predicted nucleic acid-binding protein
VSTLKRIVLDASVAISIARDEAEGPAAQAAISGWTQGGARIMVPSHFWLEVVNALVRRYGWAGADVLRSIHDLDLHGIETVDLDRAAVVLAIDLTERHRLSSYDAAYLALAIVVDGFLATFDVALAAAAGARALRPGGPPRLSEAPAAYEHAVTWPNYKGASAYLSKLRAEAVRAG